MAKETYRIDIPITTRDEYSSGIGRAKREVSRFEQAIQKTNKKLDRLTSGRWSMTLRAVDRASGIIRGVARFAERAATRTFHITVRAIDLATRPIRSIARMATSTLGILGMGGGIAGGIVMPLKMVADRQNMASAFEVLLGSAEAAQKRMDELVTFAGQTPFKRDDIFEASRILEVFTRGALSTGEGLKMVGDIAAGTQTEFIDVALWTGRLYDAMDAGRPVGEMTSRLMEMGAIGGDARDRIERLAESGQDISEIWPQVTKEFERWNGLMGKLSDNLANLALGARTFFMEHMYQRWGQGLNKAFSPALQRFREWRTENSANIATMGEEFEQFGERAANAILNPIGKASGVLSGWYQKLFPGVSDEQREFLHKGRLFGIRDDDLMRHVAEMDGLANQTFEVRFQMVVEDIKENYLDEWMESLREKVPAGALKVGETYGNFIRAGILTVLGENDDDSFMSIGGEAGRSFVTGLVDAIDPWDLTKRILSKVAQINRDAWTEEGSHAGALFANALILAIITKLARATGIGAALKMLIERVLGRGGGGEGTPPIVPGKGRGNNSKGGGGGTTVTGTNTGSKGTDQNQKPNTQSKASPVIVDSKGNPISSKTSPVRTTPNPVVPTPKPSVVRRAWDRVTTPIKTGIDKVRSPVKRGIDRALDPLKKIGDKIKLPNSVNSVLRRIPLLGAAIGGLSVATAPQGQRAEAAGGAVGALAGGAAGAALGSVVPGVGTLIGGIGGSIIGGIGGERLIASLRPNRAQAAESTTGISNRPQEIAGSAGVNPMMQQMQAQMMASSMKFIQSMQRSAQIMTIFTMFAQRLTMMLMQGGTLLMTGIQRSGMYMTLFSLIIMQITMALMSSGVALMTSIQQSALFMQMFSLISMQISLGMMGSGMMLMQSIQQSAMFMQMFSMITMQMTLGMMGSGMLLVMSIQQTAISMQLMAGITMLMTSGMIGSGMTLVTAMMQSSMSLQLLTMATMQASMMTMTGSLMLMNGMMLATYGFMTLGNMAIMSGAIIIPAAASVAGGATMASASFYRLAGITNMASGWVMSINGIQVGASSVRAALSNLAARINAVPTPRVSSVSSGLRPIPYADGGMITRPHLGLVGEAGPEMIVPLSSNRRSRAIGLYDRLGKMLGVGPERAYADGGLVGQFINSSGNGGTESTTVPVGEGVKLTIEGGINPTISVTVQGAEVTDPDELANRIGDKVAAKIAKIMEEVALNMPITSGG